MINEGEDCPQVYESREVRNMLEEDADIKKLFIRKTGAGPQVEIAGAGKVSLEEVEKLVGKDVRWSRGEGGRGTRFKYVHNPLDNPKVQGDAIEDPNAVYGYRPREDGSLASFINGKWNDPIAVEGYRQDRIAYLIETKGLHNKWCQI